MQDLIIGQMQSFFPPCHNLRRNDPPRILFNPFRYRGYRRRTKIYVTGISCKTDNSTNLLWHTATDEAVPVENSYVFANACREQGIFHELHVFSNGAHGLSLANDQWYSGRFGNPYTMDLIQRIKKKVMNGELEVSPELYTFFTKNDEENEKDRKNYTPDPKPDVAVAIWPVLADHWLKKVFSR